MSQQTHFWVYTKKTESKVLKRYLYTCIHSRIIHSNQKVEATPVSVDHDMDKWINKLWYIHTVSIQS